MPTSRTPRLEPRALLRERLIDAVAISADGETVAYSERTVVDGADRTSIWIVPFRGGRPRRLTHGKWSDGRPRFSPDGRTLAFSSTRESEGEVPQIWLLPLEGGEPARLTHFKHGVSEFEWMPGGRSLAVIAHDDESPVLQGERDKGTPTVRVLRRIDWRMDGEGLLDHPRHVHLVALSGRARRLTKGDWSASNVRPHPDGRSIGFIADRTGRRDVAPNEQVHVVSLTGRVRQRSKLPGQVFRFSFDADGTPVAAALGRRPARSHNPVMTWRVNPDGSGLALTGGLDRFSGQAESDDERVTVIADGGVEAPHRIADDGSAQMLVDRELAPAAVALATAGERVAALMTLGPVCNPDVYALEPGRPPRRLTRVGETWMGRAPRPVYEELAIPGPAGPIQTFMFSPPAARSRRLPTIVEIHGGPTWAWSPSPSRDAMLWVAAGYRVVRPNIRGSYQQGAAWIKALEGHWGQVDAEDVNAVLDHLVDQGLSDPARLGAYGNSYGGFMVNWLVGTTDRLAAAVSSNGVTNQVSAYANCDVGAVYNDHDGLGSPLSARGVNLLWRQSPLRNVAEVRTPLLILQGESDLRCPPSDNEQLFVALRMLGREVEYCLYPESAHVMSYTARPDRRVDRAERILGWFRRHMRP
jgi:dipeptidyl aminopeptidase/acylaminoacyl peptidase